MKLGVLLALLCLGLSGNVVIGNCNSVRGDGNIVRVGDGNNIEGNQNYIANGFNNRIRGDLDSIIRLSFQNINGNNYHLRQGDDNTIP